MAYGYWKSGKDRDEAVFHLYFRENPFDGGYTIAAGLEQAVSYLETVRFGKDDLDFLATLQLFSDDFLRHLEQFRFTCDVDAIPEGTVVFPQEPLVRVTGPILEAQFVETALLNMINFQSLIATKAARVVYAANEANYCATCQTEGRLLADRSLSRLLHDDWPRTLEELEG